MAVYAITGWWRHPASPNLRIKLSLALYGRTVYDLTLQIRFLVHWLFGVCRGLTFRVWPVTSRFRDWEATRFDSLLVFTITCRV